MPGRARREDFLNYMRTYPAQSIPLQARQQAYEFLLRQTAAAAASPDVATWQGIGPAPIGGANLNQFKSEVTGRVSALLVHPHNPDIVYLGAAQGGLWKTIDGGTTWIPLTDGQPSLAVGALAFDPTNLNTLYVGTGEPSNSGDSYYGAGILKTTDGGATWAQLGADKFTGMGISGIVVDPSHPQNVYVAGSTNVAGHKPLLSQPGIYKSTNGGASWTGVATVCDSQGNCDSPSALVMDPANPAVLYAGFDQYGVLESIDAGAHWTRFVWLTSSFGRVNFAVSPSNHAVLYVGFEAPLVAGGTYGYLFSSIDGGQNWAELTGLPVSYCGEQCDYDNVITVHPADPGVVLAGGSAIYSNGIPGIDGTIFKTTDGGATWGDNDGTTAGTTIHPDLHAIAIAPSNPSTVWIGTDGGVYRSTDGGDTWQPRNGNLATLQFESVALHPTDASIVFGGLQDNAKAKTTNAGGSWLGLDVGDGGFTAIDPFNPMFWYGTRFSISGFVMQFQRNDLGGSSPEADWQLKNTGIDVNDRVQFYAPLAVDPNVAGQVYWGTQRLYRSTNRGDSWTAISPDLTKALGRFSTISSMAVLRGDSKVILVGTGDGNIQLTRNGGTTWTILTKSPLPNRYVSRVAIQDAQTMIVTYSGFDANTPTTPGHVFKTTNGGGSWVDISHTGQANGLPDLPVSALALDPDVPGAIYVGTDLGVYHSADGGASWSPFSQGLPMVAIFDLALKNYPSGKFLVAATHGRSLWRIALSQPANPTPTPTVTPTATATARPTATPTVTPTPAHRDYLPAMLHR